jgi:hypothetical protein
MLDPRKRRTTFVRNVRSSDCQRRARIERAVSTGRVATSDKARTTGPWERKSGTKASPYNEEVMSREVGHGRI